jgi:hypothetical protein
MHYTVAHREHASVAISGTQPCSQGVDRGSSIANCRTQIVLREDFSLAIFRGEPGYGSDAINLATLFQLPGRATRTAEYTKFQA